MLYTDDINSWAAGGNNNIGARAVAAVDLQQLCECQLLLCHQSSILQCSYIYHYGPSPSTGDKFV